MVPMKIFFEIMFTEGAGTEFFENPINTKNFNYHHIFIEIKGSDNKLL